MKKTLLKPLFHRQPEVIGIFYDPDVHLTKITRKLPAVKWSQTNKYWYVPLSEPDFRSLISKLEVHALIDESLIGTLNVKKHIPVPIY